MGSAGLASRMSNGRNKYQSRENRQRVRFILNKHWDPIGVAGSGIDDEYDSYVGTVYTMLMDRRTSENAIRDYLYRTATQDMGITPYEGLNSRCAETAAVLVGLRPQFETH